MGFGFIRQAPRLDARLTFVLAAAEIAHSQRHDGR